MRPVVLQATMWSAVMNVSPSNRLLNKPDRNRITTAGQLLKHTPPEVVAGSTETSNVPARHCTPRYREMRVVLRRRGRLEIDSSDSNQGPRRRGYLRARVVDTLDCQLHVALPTA